MITHDVILNYHWQLLLIILRSFFSSFPSFSFFCCFVWFLHLFIISIVNSSHTGRKINELQVTSQTKIPIADSILCNKLSNTTSTQQTENLTRNQKIKCAAALGGWKENRSDDVACVCFMLMMHVLFLFLHFGRGFFTHAYTWRHRHIKNSLQSISRKWRYLIS